MQIDKLEFLSGMKMILDEYVQTSFYGNKDDTYIGIFMNCNITTVDEFTNEPILAMFSGKINKLISYANIIEFFTDIDVLGGYCYNDSPLEQLQGGIESRNSFYNLNIDSTELIEYLIPIIENIIKKHKSS